MIRVSRGSPDNSSMMLLSMYIRELLTFRRTKLKNNNRVNDISHALALMHTVEDNLQGTVQNHRNDRVGMTIQHVESLLWVISTTKSFRQNIMSLVFLRHQSEVMLLLCMNGRHYYILNQCICKCPPPSRYRPQRQCLKLRLC